MAPHATKRRKLEHSSSPDPGQDSLSDASQSAGEEEIPDVKPASRPKSAIGHAPHTKDADSSALYAGDLYKSSIFKMQVDEMLAEVRPDYEKRLGPVDGALRRLKTLIEEIPGREAVTV